MKIKITSLIIILISSLIIFLIINESKNSEIIKEESTNNIIADEIALTLTKKEKLESMLLYDINKKPFFLRELISDKPKLILRFSETNCSFCIEHALEYLENYKYIIGIDNIIIIATFIDKNAFLFFKKKHPKLQSKTYNLKEPYLSIDKTDKPYFFVSDTNLLPKKVFIPLKEIPKRTERYFKKLNLY